MENSLQEETIPDFNHHIWSSLCISSWSFINKLLEKHNCQLWVSPKLQFNPQFVHVSVFSEGKQLPSVSACLTKGLEELLVIVLHFHT